MRKMILWTVTALALLAGPASATDFGLFGSYWDTKDADSGLGGGVKINFARIVELRASYFSDLTADVDPESRDFEIKAIPLEAGLAFKFAENERFTPYVGGGIGYYLFDTNRGDIDDETGWYAVVGADIKGASGFGFMVEGIYRGMETTVRDDDPDNIVGDVDVDFGGLGVNAGLVWSF
jgi:opacity protein-like surface antigen